MPFRLLKRRTKPRVRQTKRGGRGTRTSSKKGTKLAARLLRTSKRNARSRVSIDSLENLAHELRSAMTFVKGYVELMRSGEVGEISQGARESLDIISAKTNSVVRRLDDLLSLEDAEPPMQVPVDVARIARASIRAANATARRAGITLRADIRPVPHTLGNPTRLEQVFDNLLDNAIKYSPQGGEVRVHVSNSGRRLLVRVQDQGIGIPRNEQKKIFARFYQVENPVTRTHQGAGLGLAIVKRIVEAHRGNVGVESEEGRGSTFYFSLPTIHPKSAP